MTKTPTLDSLFDSVTGNNIGTELKDVTAKLFSHSLARIYWKKAAEARKNNDEIAADYWMTESMKKMCGFDKKRNFIR